MKIKTWKGMECGGVSMSRYVPDDGTCRSCDAAKRAQIFIDRDNAKTNMMFGTTNPMDN